jgi:DNA replication protein DnaC
LADGWLSLNAKPAEMLSFYPGVDTMARVDGSLGRLLGTIARTDVLVVDDFVMAPLSDPERRDFLEICDDRYGRRSTILTSQLPVTSWHAQIGDPTLADSILDRLVHNAYRLDLTGESIRKKKGRGRSEQTGGEA